MARTDAIVRRRPTLLRKLLRVNWPLVAVVIALTACGAAALYSAAGGTLEPWAARHVVRAIMGLAAIVAIGLVPVELLVGIAYPLYALSLLLLALVPVVGVEAMGARRWLPAGPFTFQPSELMKVALLLALARYYLWLAPEKRSDPRWLAPPLVAILVPFLLTLRQPDLGTAMLFVATGIVVLYLAGVSILYFLGTALGLAALTPFALSMLHDYQRRRIETFLDPERDPLGAGYHITQAKIALGAGGLKGTGFMKGTQSQLDFVPEKQTDFIFASIAEEWGFVGAVGLTGLYLALFLVLVAMALAVRNQFGRLLIAGVGMMIFTQMFINIAMVTGLVPVVGVPLPFVSYGGTAMVSVMTAVGLAMSAYVHRDHQFRREDVGFWW
jgi:rod shape determining protein RodA